MSARRGQVYKKRKPYEVIICPHCLTEGRGSVMKRWHFARCKDAPVESRAVTEKNYIHEEEDEETKD